MGTSHAEGEALRRRQVAAIAEEVRKRGRKHASGEPLFFDNLNLELAIEAALTPLSGPVDASGEPDYLDQVGEGLDGLQSYETQEIESMRGLEGHEDWLKLDDVRAMMARLRNRRAAAAVPSSPAQEEALHGLEHSGVHSVGDSNRPDGMECVSSDSPLPPSSPVADSPTPDVSAKYHELLYAVAKKHQGESRHDTALRYIRQAEQQTSGPASAPSPSAGAARDKD